MNTSYMDFFPLEHYGYNLTQLAGQGVFSPLAESDTAVTRIFQILLRREKTTSHCNPLILDLDGSTRWSAITEVIRRMAVGEAPDPLPKRQVIALDYEALFTDLSDDPFSPRKPVKSQRFDLLAQTAPELEEAWALLDELFRWPSLEKWVAPTTVLERLQSIFLALHQAAGSFLLCVDHFHRLVGGERDRYPIDAAELLKPTLARGEIQLIGACTLTQHRQYIEQDAAIYRRMQEVLMPDALEECQQLLAQQAAVKQKQGQRKSSS